MLVVFVLSLLVACTFAAPQNDTRIVGGSTAGPGSFPYQISLRRNGGHICGGSILNPTTVLTAAHCVYGSSPSGHTVVVGTNSIYEGGTSYRATRFIVHQGYNQNTISNDVAIIKIASSIQYNNLVSPISLAQSNPPDGAHLIISGWGYTRHPGGSTPVNLLYLLTSNLNLNLCSRMLADISTPITRGNVCTFSSYGQGICMGDSGGPLVNSDKEQVGIASWVIPCGMGYPDVFTSVATYRSWIMSNM